MVYQKEMGDNGTPHYQGYLELHKKITLGGLKKFKGWGRAHFEQAGGSLEQNVAYCTKTDGRLSEPVYFGIPKNPGNKRKGDTPLDVACNMVKDGKKIKEVAEENLSVVAKHYRGLTFLNQMFGPVRRWKTEVTVYWGPPGTGKSYKANDTHPDAYKVPKNSGNNFWFDGYDGQDVIILDDFYGWLPLTFMLEFLDAYPMRLPIKGGFTQMLAKKVIITSNRKPDGWYEKAFLANEGHRVAFMRRIENVGEFTSFKEFVLTHPASDLRELIQGPRAFYPGDREIEEKKHDIERGEEIDINDEWDVGGGAQCELCEEDIRVCQNKCQQQLTPVRGLTILGSMQIPVTQQEINWDIHCSIYDPSFTVSRLEKEFEKLRVECLEKMIMREENRIRCFSPDWPTVEHLVPCKPFAI